MKTGSFSGTLRAPGEPQKGVNMANYFDQGKRRKRLAGALGLLLSATLTLGIVTACAVPANENDDEGKTPTLPPDTQLLKNGNFEFYSEMTEKKQDERRDFINSPNNWTFSSGSPSSDASSGIVNLADWKYMSESTFSLVPAEEDRVDDPELTASVVSYADAHWDEASLYDRLEFYDYYDIDSKSEFEKYGDYDYSLDFDDVKKLKEIGEKGDPLDLYEKEGRKTDGSDGDSSILMIHNDRSSDYVLGTAQYYTGTTVTLSAGTSAELKVRVRTSQLYHYTSNTNAEDDLPVEARAGAYISITNTIGGSEQDKLQVKNIITKDKWQTYTFYIRANTFASTTFRVVLGLGQGTSDYRYEAVNGYAFFDDVECNIIPNEPNAEKPDAMSYEKAVEDNGLNLPGRNFAGLNDKGDSRIFYATDDAGAQSEYNTFALDLYAPFETYGGVHNAEVQLTQEVSGSKTYDSGKISPSLSDNRGTSGTEKSKQSIAGVYSLAELSNMSRSGTANYNGYLKDIYEKDFANFPFEQTDDIVLLLSTNGAAYTAKLDEFEVNPNEKLLLSFFVKTSDIRSGKTGGGALLVDGENKTAITPFNSVNVSKVDIDDDNKDIYDGWVQCFFFVENTTDTLKVFHIELTYGPTSIAESSVSDYTAGYAAFANFETSYLTKDQYGFAQTGTYAQKVSLTASVTDSSKFDDASANGTQLEYGLATPVNYTGVLAGSNVLIETTYDADGNVSNRNPDPKTLATKNGIYAGLLSYNNAENYLGLDPDEADGSYLPNGWMKALNKGGITLPEDTEANRAERDRIANEWWKSLFGNAGSAANTAYQPLVILNTSADAQPSYGFFAGNTSISSNSSSRISVRVKLSEGAKVHLYLIDVSDVKSRDKGLAMTLPSYTYWYDDDGNIVNGDPAAKDFDEEKDIAFTLEDNGLYKKVGDTTDTYYANLANFETDKETSDLLASDGSIAYYFHDGKYYAYRTGEEGAYEYKQVVTELPKTGDFVRYTNPNHDGYNDGYTAVIEVEGTSENANKWITVSFYVQTGNTAKDYRLELWAGERTNKENGLPAGASVFFDRCSTASASNYSALLEESRDAMLAYAEGSDHPYQDKNDPKKIASEYGLYYTFTFFDSPAYLRYDKTEDEKELGNPWQDYVQSSYEESLVWLRCSDLDGKLFSPDGTGLPTVSLFMSYASNEVTVTPADLGGDDDSSSSGGSTNTTDTPNDGTNVWMLASSILLVVALLITMLSLAGRKLYQKYKKDAPKAAKKKERIAPVRAAKAEEAPVPEEPAPEPEEEAPAEQPDENDPYNE